MLIFPLLIVWAILLSSPVWVILLMRYIVKKRHQTPRGHGFEVLSPHNSETDGKPSGNQHH
jgi:hypothetical protein